jgi:Flp pilus assembly protein TadD/predicted Zn-dependent protease
MVALAGGALAALATNLPWIQNIESGSKLETLIFRSMPLPSGPVTVRRPPSETVPALTGALAAEPHNAELYSLRAMEEEQKQDFKAAEADWKLAVANAGDKGAMELELADFYHLQLHPADEVRTLSVVAQMPSPPAEKFVPVVRQRSWRVFERIFSVIHEQALGAEVAESEYKLWLRRYPRESGLWGRYFEYLLAQKKYHAAAELILDHGKAFPEDKVFPVKAQALLHYRQGSVAEGLAVYEHAYQPLWPEELIKNYFDLLRETGRQHKFLENAQSALQVNPDDLKAVSQIFYYYQQQQKLDAGVQAITEYRLHKEARHQPWSATELSTCAQLMEKANAYPEAARYYYALYSSGAAESPGSKEQALAGILNILLTNPQAPVRIGAGELSMYRDVATTDTGPGFLNGILSLILNTTDPQAELAEEEKRAVPYFHRARAAELLALFDGKFPKSARRAGLHAALIAAYVEYGEHDAVISSGRKFLADFPNAAERTQVALEVADAFAATDRNEDEFAIYDSLLKELAKKAEGVPLGDEPQLSGDQSFPQTHAMNETAQASQTEADEDQNTADDSTDNADDSADDSDGAADNSASDNSANSSSGTFENGRHQRRAKQQAFAVGSAPTATAAGPHSPDYQRVLDRYVSRLVSEKDVPRALRVLRAELDRNPNDPGLYLELLEFLDQNQLGTELQAVYRRAMQQFPGPSWYHKLARWYLRQDRKQDFEALSKEVVGIFSGSDVEAYLADVGADVSEISLRLNQYANHRFPHNLAFVRLLLRAYRTSPYCNETAWEALMRQHWFESDDLRAEFFEDLSRKGRLETELAALENNTPTGEQHNWPGEAASNPVAARFVAEAELWQSHFETAAPVVDAVAAQYPADVELGTRASSLYRSLAYFEPKDTKLAVEIEQRLLESTPGDRERLARIGDIYADRELFPQAAPYWNRMALTAPGESSSYRDAATVFWDYYDFANALRLLHEGRSRLHDENLYRYEVGAIYENKREPLRAIAEYVPGALASSGDSPARGRLLALAKRPRLKKAVDAATAKAVAGVNPDLDAVHLRIAVLEAQERRADLRNFLVAVIEKTDSIETLEDLTATAEEKSLESVERTALEREAALTSDAIKRLELRYELANLLEGEKNITAAENQIETLYRENPKILGVVRATIDFYWRHHLEKQAIAVAVEAAHSSYPELKTKFAFEAARKMTEAGEYAAARELLAPLMAESPYNEEYLAATAETYARAGDNQGLRDFYLEKIAFLRKASLPEEKRKDRIAALRRGLIPALTRMKDYAGAVDQYIEILNRYPEDESLTTEAAIYAHHHGRQQPLLNFYSKTIAASPRDARWPALMGRMQTNYEDFSGAIASYSKAISIRPDRMDLVIARATLAERLLRFEDAANDYAKVYDLSYHDRQWMEKAAELRARQGKKDLAVAALKTAWIDRPPDVPSNYFTVAQRLECWGMLEEARDFAQQGISKAGDNLLADTQYQPGLELYARIMTRLRQPEEAYRTLHSALEAAAKPPAMPALVSQDPTEAASIQELHQNAINERISHARQGMGAALRAIGETVHGYYTPEEKLQFRTTFVEPKHAGMTQADVEDFLLPLADAADLSEQATRWRYELLLEDPEHTPLVAVWEETERRRLKLEELGAELEKLASLSHRPMLRDTYLLKAQDAYQSTGDSAGELRVLSEMTETERYWQLLLAADPQQLVKLAGMGDERDRVTNYIIAHGDAQLAEQAILERGHDLSPVWKKSYTALVGLYFHDRSPRTQAAFLDALGDETIGKRLDEQGDRSEQLADDTWFYYGLTYGLYLQLMRKGDAEEFLPAYIENTPGRASAYVETAQDYQKAADLAHAIADYKHALELAPRYIEAHEGLAEIRWQQNRKPEAISEWKTALDLLRKQAELSYSQTFSTDYAMVVDAIGKRHLFAQLRPEIEQVLRAYVKESGDYEVEPLLCHTFAAWNNPAEAVTWLIRLSTAAPSPVGFLESMVNSQVVPMEKRGPLYESVLKLYKGQVAASEGAARDLAESSLHEWQIQWLEYLVKTKQLEQAASELAALPAEMRQASQEKLAPVELEIAARRNGLEAKLDLYRADPDHAPKLETLRLAATRLAKKGDKKSARQILEFAFSEEIAGGSPTVASMMGLAEIRIETGDLRAALELLQRMTLVVGDAFTHQADAADLLMRTGHPTEAVPFLEELVTAVPWEPAYRVRLAQAEIAAGKDDEAARHALATIAASPRAVYELRTTAASALAGSRPHADLGSGELNLLASGRTITPAEANHAFYGAARLKAAEKLAGSAERFALLRAAIEESPGNNTVRPPLFRAALGSGNYALALTAVYPVMGDGFPRNLMQKRGYDDWQGRDQSAEPDPEESQDDDTDASADMAGDSVRERVPHRELAALQNTPSKERAQTAADLALALEKIGDLTDAMEYLRAAYEFETAASQKTQINNKLAELKAVVKRASDNAGRQPLIHEALEQDVEVLPRLEVQSPTTAAHNVARQGELHP